MAEIPRGWSFEPDYYFDGAPAWWHDDCLTPTVTEDGEIGGMAYEERIKGRLVAVHCYDCDASFSIARRPTTKVP